MSHLESGVFRQKIAEWHPPGQAGLFDILLSLLDIRVKSPRWPPVPAESVPSHARTQ